MIETADCSADDSRFAYFNAGDIVSLEHANILPSVTWFSGLGI